jgi:hypothetical protein
MYKRYIGEDIFRYLPKENKKCEILKMLPVYIKQKSYN